MKESIGKINLGQRSRTCLIFVPATVVTDSTFPFKKLPLHCKVSIDGERLVIEKIAEVKA